MDKIGPFEWNTCYYMDCIEGLKQLPDKSIDLCLTDPPYNIDFKSMFGLDRLPYNDRINDYRAFSEAWFMEVIRISNGLVFTPGMSNLWDWILLRKPNYQPRFWYKPNGCGYDHIEPFLLYGEVKNVSCLRDVVVSNKLSPERDCGKFNHPTIKQYDVWEYYIRKLKPKSILDPFLGSGTTAQAAESLGIPWLGFEIMKEYKPDIDKRIALGKKEFKKPKQRSLW